MIGDSRQNPIHKNLRIAPDFLGDGKERGECYIDRVNFTGGLFGRNLHLHYSVQ